MQEIYGRAHNFTCRSTLCKGSPGVETGDYSVAPFGEAKDGEAQPEPLPLPGASRALPGSSRLTEKREKRSEASLSLAVWRCLPPGTGWPRICPAGLSSGRAGCPAWQRHLRHSFPSLCIRQRGMGHASSAQFPSEKGGKPPLSVCSFKRSPLASGGGLPPPPPRAAPPGQKQKQPLSRSGAGGAGHSRGSRCCRPSRGAKLSGCRKATLTERGKRNRQPDHLGQPSAGAPGTLGGQRRAQQLGPAAARDRPPPRAAVEGLRETARPRGLEDPSSTPGRGAAAGGRLGAWPALLQALPPPIANLVPSRCAGLRVQPAGAVRLGTVGKLQGQERSFLWDLVVGSWRFCGLWGTLRDIWRPSVKVIVGGSIRGVSC
ncbi:uncharacterized protein LOC131202627 [Ahaetulla prasina]|uniref:uncharacterized protein LOC131202627 n=1 Tax=Ahaetulla prasina TaxID=499056 RepID=UPI002647754E|nr:uncharacterized protein LOC131202627 [Ahaetulla prasina]